MGVVLQFIKPPTKGEVMSKVLNESFLYQLSKVNAATRKLIEMGYSIASTEIIHEQKIEIRRNETSIKQILDCLEDKQWLKGQCIGQFMGVIVWWHEPSLKH